MRVLQACLIYVALFAAAATMSVSCIEVTYKGVSYRCDPKQGPDACPEDDAHEWVCCSDDPAAAPGRLPDYSGDEDDDMWGEPLFSGKRNDLSRSGMCVDVGPDGVAGALTEPARCLTPCNPTWSNDEISEVCGSDRQCCQTVEITEKDCTFDPDLNCWRPALGTDIGNDDPDLNDANPSFVGMGDMWSQSSHDTHQDPGGGGCKTLATVSDEVSVRDCHDRLGVANQRGFCVSGAFTNCNRLLPGYQDACELKNEAEGFECGSGDDDDDDDDEDGEE
ncbi:MAG: hypothetical protein B7733_04760 [Myxococcales bacterium FL481]|nr:MAG: hypothetical protein B7733_04760 [Myxococcales bacterium FL481]